MRTYVQLEGISKEYASTVLFQNVSIKVEKNQIAIITGKNGSGKSSLLRLLIGIESADKGSIYFYKENQNILPTDWYKHISMVAPSMQLPMELTVKEIVTLHSSFKQMYTTTEEFLHHTHLYKDKNKLLQQLSTGMLQRLKLGLAFFTISTILVIDEPTSNLDEEHIQWYQTLLKNHLYQRIVFIATNNIPQDAPYYDYTITLQDYK